MDRIKSPWSSSYAGKQIIIDDLEVKNLDEFRE